MIEINTWLDAFLQSLNQTFPDRILFVGLQGSYGRAEATETSDIDIVVILDELSAPDLQTYGAMLDTLPNRDMICGFLSGRNELLNWEPSDLFQFYYDTTPIRGDLDDILPLLDDDAVNRAIKIGACNIYHGCVHNMLHDKSDELLKGLYKAASFVVQAICFDQTGKYYRHQKELLRVAGPEECAILRTFIGLKNGAPVQFREQSEALFTWAQKWLGETNRK